MKAPELRGRTSAELQTLLGELRGKLTAKLFLLAQGKAKNVREIRGTKKDIARILTILRKREHEPTKA